MPETEGEIDARIAASAADLAVAKGSGPITPPFLEELVSLFWHRLYGNSEVKSKELASHSVPARLARRRVGLAGENRTRNQRRVRELASERKRMRRPIAGVTLTQPWAMLLCLVPGVVIEIFGSAPSLQTAFELDKYVAWLFAGAISAVLILAADLLGNTLASTTARAHLRSATVAVLLVVVAVGSGAWAVVRLAESRATNLAYRASASRAPTTSTTAGEFSTSAGAPASEARPQESTGPDSPDYGFFIPLSTLIVATATLFAFRIELAGEWNEVARAIDEGELEMEVAREDQEKAALAVDEATTPETEAILDLSAMVERERALLGVWIGRFAAEYHRFCAAESKDPRPLTIPRIPDDGEVLEQILATRGGGGGSGGGGGAPRADRERGGSRDDESGGEDPPRRPPPTSSPPPRRPPPTGGPGSDGGANRRSDRGSPRGMWRSKTA